MPTEANTVTKCERCGHPTAFGRLCVTCSSVSEVAIEMRQPRFDSNDLDHLLGVGGELWTFINQARSDYRELSQYGMARRAQELLDKIEAQENQDNGS